MALKYLKGKLKLLPNSLIIYLVTILFILPYIYLIFLSFKHSADIQAFPPKLLSMFTLDNYIKVFKDVNLLFFMKNSFIVAISNAILAILFAMPAAYAMSRFKVKFKEGISFIYLAIQMAPAIALVYPISIIVNNLGIFDNLAAVILFYLPWNIPFAVWMLRPFISGVPYVLEEAAFVDGCSRFNAFRRITLPLLLPGLFVSVIFIFMGAWNEFVIAFFITNNAAKTLPTTADFFLTYGSFQWGAMFAAATLGTLPIVIFGLFLRKYYLVGMTGGAIKG